MPGKPSRERRRKQDCTRSATAAIPGPPLDEEAAAAFRFARETERGERHGYWPAGERAHRFAFETSPAPFEGRATAPLFDHVRRSFLASTPHTSPHAPK